MSEACETISIKGGGDVRNDILHMIAVKFPLRASGDSQEKQRETKKGRRAERANKSRQQFININANAMTVNQTRPSELSRNASLNSQNKSLL